MTESDRHNKNSPNADKLIREFPEEERPLIRTIWERSLETRLKFEEVSDGKVEEALNNVHRRIAEGNTNGSTEETAIVTPLKKWRWVMAAASVLLILGLGILLVPHKIEVPYAQITEVTLPDGSEVTLNSGSTLKYSRLFSLLDREVTLNGEAYFSINDRDNELLFRVKTNGTVVEVTGTEFNVRSWREEPDSRTEVVVAEGTVRFYPDNRKEQSVSVAAGLMSHWKSGLTAPTEADSVKLDHVLGWKNQKFAFTNKPLGIILQELERRFDVPINLEADEYFNENVTIYYVNPQSAEPILQDICRIKGLRYAEASQGYRVYK